MKKITLDKINPVIRGANYASVTPLHFGPRINYGYQLFYVFKGSGSGRINENYFTLYPGLLALYGPGDIHEFKSYKSMTFTTIYFSWHELDAERMAAGNQNVTELNDAYWKLAYPLVSVEYLPEIPFDIEIPLQERMKIEEILRDTGNNFRKSIDPCRLLKQKAYLLEIIHSLMKFNRNLSGNTEHHTIRRFREYIDKNYLDELNRTAVSRSIGISESYLTALLRQQLNTNFTEYLTSVRMQKAIELLQYSNLSVKEITAAAGFRNYNYFVARFRQIYGKTPGKYR